MTAVTSYFDFHFYLPKYLRKYLDRLRVAKAFYVGLVVGKKGFDQISLLVAVEGDVATALKVAFEKATE